MPVFADDKAVQPPILHPEAGIDSLQNEPIATTLPIDNSPQTEQIAPIAPTEINETPTVDIDFLINNPNAFAHVFYQAVINDDAETLRLLVPFYHQLPRDYQDEILLLFAQSKIALSDNNHKLALQLLTELSQKQPNLTAVKMQIASLLLKNKHDQKATIILNELKTSVHFNNLTTTEKKWLIKQSAILTRKYKPSIDIGMNLLYLDNINSASTTEQKNISKEKPKSTHGLALSLDLDKYTPLNHGLSLYTGLDIDGKFYRDNSHNEASIFANIGLKKNNTHGFLSITPFIGRNFATDNKQNLVPRKNSIGAAFNWQHKFNNELNKTWQNNLFIRAEHGNYQKSYQGYNGNRYHLSDTIVLQNNPKRRYSLGINYQLSDLTDAAKSSHTVGVNLGILQQFNNGFFVQGKLSAERERYHGKLLRLVNPNNVYRTDKTITLQTAVWHKNINWQGITPRLSYRYVNNKSNLPALYSYKKHSVFLEFGRSF
ncbi:surface lipoprotein assembly modifier [Moraxella macacae]|nr:surface lipoprotein assembly modifier [Moraxella macacae]